MFSVCSIFVIKLKNVASRIKQCLHSLMQLTTQFKRSTLYCIPKNYKRKKQFSIIFEHKAKTISSETSPSGAMMYVNPYITHTNPWGRLKWSYGIIRLTAYFMCGLMSDLVLCKFRKRYGHTWHRMSLLGPDVIKQHKPKPFKTSPCMYHPKINQPHLVSWQAQNNIVHDAKRRKSYNKGRTWKQQTHKKKINIFHSKYV